MRGHEHRESKTCSCYILGLEPDESCPVHGMGEWPPRCEICGQFVKRKEISTEDLTYEESVL